MYFHDPATSGVDRATAILQELADFFAFVRGTVGYRNGPQPGYQWATRDPSLATAMSEALKDGTWSRAADAAHVFDLCPPLGKAGLALVLEGAPTAGTVNLLFTGNTWPWRAAFDGADVPGGYVEEEAEGVRTYVRMLTGVRVAEAEEAGWLRQLFSDALRGCPVLLRPIDEEDRESATVAATRAFLLTLPSIVER